MFDKRFVRKKKKIVCSEQNESRFVGIYEKFAAKQATKKRSGEISVEFRPELDNLRAAEKRGNLGTLVTGLARLATVHNGRTDIKRG